MKQTGARFLANERKKLQVKEPTCTNHVKRESVLIHLKSGAVKRART